MSYLSPTRKSGGDFFQPLSFELRTQVRVRGWG